MAELYRSGGFAPDLLSMAAAMDDNSTSQEVQCLATSRSRRAKKDKGGRFDELAKIKAAKARGEKWKYQVEEESAVYEEVDEDEYSRIVQDRQEDDWIIDDDGSGYVEDGREIFDDEAVGELPTKGKKPGAPAVKKKSQNPNIRAPGTKAKNIKSMFAAAAVKVKPRAEKDVKLSDDALLGDILGELQQDPASNALMPAPLKMKKKTTKSAYNPFATTPTTTPKKPYPAKPLTPRNMTTEISPPEEKPEPKPEPKPKKIAPKRIMRTALDDLSDEPEYTKVKVKEEEVPDDIPMENDENNENMDVSDINFDDDFDDGAAKTKSMVNGHVKVAGVKKEVEDLPELSSSGWETLKGDDVSNIPVDVQVDSSKLPLVTNDNGEQVLRMYWFDAYEDQYKQPGIVYLFGKVWIESAKSHVSCCVAVKNIERRVFLLPRKTKYDLKAKYDTGTPVSFIDVYQEFNDRIAEQYKIMKFKSMKVTKQYAFEKEEVPVESDYLEVRYSAESPRLPEDLQGETFSHAFGCNTSSLEHLLLLRKLKGPSWIDIKMPQLPSPGVSWCKVEAFVNKPEYITVVTSSLVLPPLTVMTLNLRTLPNPRTHQNEIIAAACLVQHKFHLDKPAPKPLFQQHFCALSKPADCIFPYDFKDHVQKQSKTMKVDIMGTERALLGFLLAKVHKIDPDVIVGHDILGFDLDVLLHRIEHNKIPHWSRLGRLKRSQMPKLYGSGRGKGSSSANAACGRLITDVMISAKELIRCRSYDLTELVSHVLKDKRQEVDSDQIRNCFNSSPHLLQLIEWTLVDSNLILRMMYELMVLPLALQITTICGNVMARTLMGGRSERNEFLLLHAFDEKNFIVPDKSYAKKTAHVPSQQETHSSPTRAGYGSPVMNSNAEPTDDDADQTVSSKKSGRRKPAYAGGLVLDPKKGFYDKFILLLDFNSLYPSIIQEYNICFTTVSRTGNSNEEELEDGEMPNLVLPDESLEPGILPTEIRKLVQSRRQVKQLMKTPDLAQEAYMQYDIRQKALKLTANSMYGCLGFTYSRFFAKPLAALVTGKGREILMKTRDLVQAMNLDVIYGDTDSIMVNTNCLDIEQVFKLGNKIKNEVNRLYKLLEIDIDGVFKSMLLLKKKKYAALTITKVGDKYVTAQELKGLDIVRRDWCMLAKEAGNFVVSQILSGESRETILENIHSKLQEVGEKVQNGEIPVDLYQITKSLTKNPEDYPDKKSLPHVQVALRYNSKGGKKMRAGDTVYYVVCDDGSTLPASQRAYHPEELSKSETLKIDTKYYLANQVHPVVARLCDPIDGTDAAHIAECLGLDGSGYRQAMQREQNNEDEALLGSAISDEEKYRDCDRFKYRCTTCGKEIIMDNVFAGAGTLLECVLGKCTNTECTCVPADNAEAVMNQLTVAIRGHIKMYYEGWLKCEDTACGHRTRKVSQVFHQGRPVCQTCNKSLLKPEYTDSMLYSQLCFYRFIFDVDRATLNLTDSKEKDIARRISLPYMEAYRRIKAHVDRRIKQSAYSEVNLAQLFHGLFSLK